MYHALYSFVRGLRSVLNKLERKDELVSLPWFSKSRMSNLDIQILARLALKSALSSEPPQKKEGNDIFTTYLSYDVITAGVMFILLAIAAWSDNHGAEVSDTITVPYAIFGCYAAFLHERWVTACICVILLTAVLIGIRVPLWDKVNAFLMKRAYADESAMDEETAALEEQAEQFAEANGKDIENSCMLADLGGTLALIFATILMPDKLEPIPVIALFIFIGMMLVLYRAKDTANRAGDVAQAEDLTAFGGADAIVFIGILAFYGPVGFVYGMTATMAIALIWGVFLKLKKKTVGIPLLPAILAAAPMRVYIAYALCPQVEQAFRWAIHNLSL